MQKPNTHFSILQSIGNTPLIKLDCFDVKPTILAKLEYTNPGGSVKDRSALFMIEEAERQGLLKEGGTIIEASSGNQGIGIAMIGAVKGYQVIVTVPDRTSNEKIATLQAYGAKVYVCPDTEDLENPEGYHAKAAELCRKIPGAYMPNQYYNVQNPRAHYLTTGPEIWQQTEGKVTHCFIAMGSCGTISGIGKYLKEQNNNVKIFGVDIATSNLSCPACPQKYKSEGLGVDVVTDTLDRSVIDQILTITDEEAFATTKKLAKMGYLAGISSGAAIHKALEHAKNLSANDIIVVIFADSGRAYLSKVFS